VVRGIETPPHRREGCGGDKNSIQPPPHRILFPATRALSGVEAEWESTGCTREAVAKCLSSAQFLLWRGQIHRAFLALLRTTGVEASESG